MNSALVSTQHPTVRCTCRRLPVPFRPARVSKPRTTFKTYAIGLPEVHDVVASSWHAVSHSAQHLFTVADDDFSAAATAAATAAAAAAQAQADASSSGNPVDWLADGFEAILKVLNGLLENANVPYAYGWSIVLLTILVKVATFPLSQKQVESTLSLQALQPRVKELQARHANDPETLQLETARLYRDAGVNPLAGCLPTLATIPVFIGLYRALTKAANEGLLTDPFFFIPSLGGPASMAAQQDGTGLSWLFPLQNGAPPIGWHDAGAYLVLPLLLVVSQFVTQKLISPQQSDDPAQQSTQAILKFLPLMIGWFSLNVPSGLTLYWFTNNILSTAQQLYLKKTIQVAIPDSPAPTGISSATPIVKPKEERVVKKVTGKELGSRKKKRDDDDDDKGNKFRALKAREAALKAASIAQPTASNGSTGGSKGEGFAALKAQEAATTTNGTATEIKVPDAPPAKDNSSN